MPPRVSPSPGGGASPTGRTRGSASPGARSPARSASPAAKAPGGPPPGASRKKALPDTSKRVPRQRDKARVDPREQAEQAEKERQARRQALIEHIAELLARTTDKGDEIDASFKPLVENLCNELMAWIKSPAGDSARVDEYTARAARADAAFVDAVAKTKEKRQEPPLPLNIFNGNQIIVTTSGRQLEAAVKDGDLVEVKRLLATQRGRALLNTSDARGWTPLHYAVCQGDEGVSSELLRAGAEVDAAAQDGTTCMHLACGEGRSHMIEVLVKAGAATDPEMKETLWTPLHTAASIGSIKPIRLLLDAQANPNATARGDWRPLHCAAMNGHFDAAAVLMLPRVGAKEPMADNEKGLEMMTGDGTIKVQGLRASDVAKAHGFEETEDAILAAAMKIQQEHAAEAARKAAEKAAAAAEAEAEQAKNNKKGGRTIKGRSVSPTSRSPPRGARESTSRSAKQR